MTSRKLYLWLLATVVLMTGGAWWSSYRFHSDFILTPLAHHSRAPFSLTGNLYHATVALSFHPSSPLWKEMKVLRTSSIPENLFSEEWKRTLPSHGDFAFGFCEPSRSGVRQVNAYIVVPVWLPCLLLAGGGWWLVRWHEKRSSAARETKLAARDSARDTPRE